jgi:Homing endonuclease associated repeat/HNH endonuclease
MPARKYSRSRGSGRAGTARRSSGKIIFELKPWYHNVPEKELIADLRRVARLLGAETLPRETYRSHSKYSPVTLVTRFGSWNGALKRAGLKPSSTLGVPAQLIVDDIKRVARKLKVTTLTCTRYHAVGKYQHGLIRRRFGSWPEAAHAAGIYPNQYKNISTKELFENLERVWRTLGHQPSRAEMVKPLSKYSLYPFDVRYGGYRNALRAFVKWKAKNPSGKSIGGCVPPPTRSVQKAISLHKTSRKINLRLRFIILKRDNYKCKACGQSPANDPSVKLEVDHIIPWSVGGETVEANLQTLCWRCNIGKSNL